MSEVRLKNAEGQVLSFAVVLISVHHKAFIIREYTRKVASI